MFSDSFRSSPTKLLFILIESVRNGGKIPWWYHPPPPALFSLRLGHRALFLAQLSHLNPQEHFGWRRTSPSLVLCLIITRKICAPTCQVILLTQTAVTTMKIGFPEQGGQCDINESQLSQDWAAREHKWGPLSTHTPIMIFPGRTHSAKGLEAPLGGVFQVLAVNLATPQGWFLLLRTVPPTGLFCLDPFHHFRLVTPKICWPGC